MPLLMEIMSALRRSDERKELRQLGQWAQQCELEFTDPENFEALLADLDTWAELGNEVGSTAAEFSIALKKQFVALMGERHSLVGRPDVGNQFGRPHPAYLDFVNALAKARVRTVINFNYDLHVELAVSASFEKHVLEQSCSNGALAPGIDCPDVDYHIQGQPIHVGFDDRQMSNYFSPSSGSLHLLKPHGSMNWFVGPDGEVGIMHPDYLLTNAYANWGAKPAQNLVANPFKAMDASQASRKSGWAQASPLLLPPSHKKATVRELSSIMEAAVLAVSEARQIIFAGYSFPRSDKSVMDWLIRPMQPNLDQEITIVNPNPQSVSDNAQDALGQGWAKRIRTLDHKFEEADWAKILCEM